MSSIPDNVQVQIRLLLCLFIETKGSQSHNVSDAPLFPSLFPPLAGELGQKSQHSGIATHRHFLRPRFRPGAHVEVMALRTKLSHRDVIFSSSVCIPKFLCWSLLPFFTPPHAQYVIHALQTGTPKHTVSDLKEPDDDNFSRVDKGYCCRDVRQSGENDLCREHISCLSGTLQILLDFLCTGSRNNQYRNSSLFFFLYINKISLHYIDSMVGLYKACTLTC